MPMKRVRLDLLLVERGLAVSRERARALVLAGQVRVAGRPVSKAGQPVDPDAPLELATADHPYVSRGGIKLAHALDVFGVAVDDRDALDIGASTGGFTDALLKAGARSVVALDVGHGQLAWSLRNDPRVVVLERVNVRHLTPEHLPETHRTFDVVTIDVSFISLRRVLPAVPPVLRPGANVIALVKPQFEAGREEVGRGGIVRDPEVHARVVREVAAAADALGFQLVAQSPSPIEGADGNREFLVHFRRSREQGAGSKE
jgi:23S rRNA (cytidine1920-2'-O)/16S rRNA (cytidine1409-2'-O)-methyltransferase